MSSKKTQKESWFKGLDREFKKIVWPDKMTVAKETARLFLYPWSWERLSHL